MAAGFNPSKVAAIHRDRQSFSCSQQQLQDSNDQPCLHEIVCELESAGWDDIGGHPMGSNIVTQVIDLFFGVFGRSGTGCFTAYVQESPGTATIDVAISFMALYYTFFGIYAADHSSLSDMPLELEDADQSSACACTAGSLWLLSRAYIPFTGTTHLPEHAD